MLTTRRTLLAAASATLAAAPRPAWAQNLSRGVFTDGVASGDPLPDGIADTICRRERRAHCLGDRRRR